jgi:outer membrane protein OmpA-like peptidoglycan-associated protein
MMLNLRSFLMLGVLAFASPALADTANQPTAEADVATTFATAMSAASTDVTFYKLIEFAPASTRIYSADRELLQRLAKTWLQSGQQTLIQVNGYSEALDLRLAERRAELVRRYLIKSGVAPERVTTVGHTLEPDGRRIDLSISRCAACQCATRTSRVRR